MGYFSFSIQMNYMSDIDDQSDSSSERKRSRGEDFSPKESLFKAVDFYKRSRYEHQKKYARQDIVRKFQYYIEYFILDDEMINQVIQKLFKDFNQEEIIEFILGESLFDRVDFRGGHDDSNSDQYSEQSDQTEMLDDECFEDE